MLVDELIDRLGKISLHDDQITSKKASKKLLYDDKGKEHKATQGPKIARTTKYPTATFVLLRGLLLSHLMSDLTFITSL